MPTKIVLVFLGLFSEFFFPASIGWAAGASVAANPVPVLRSISPPSAKAGSPALTIQVTGSAFVAGSQVMWKSTALATTFASATALAAKVPAADLEAGEDVAITVINPAPGGGATKNITFAIENPVPVLSSISPSSATQGSTAVVLHVKGADFLPRSQVQWNGKALPTTHLSSTELAATVSSADLTATGAQTVKVVNEPPGGGTSKGISFTIKALPTTVKTLSTFASDLAWDPVHGKIYLSLPSNAAANSNSVQIVDPATGTLGAVESAGSEPNLLSVSRTGKYLYVGLDGTAEVQRMILPELKKDIVISLGGPSYFGPYFALDLQAAPDSDEEVAVVRGTLGIDPEENGGVLIYDNATALKHVLCGFGVASGCQSSNPGKNSGNVFDSIQWNSTGTEMYAGNTEDGGLDFYVAQVSSTGFGKVTDDPSLISDFGVSIHYDAKTGYVYDDGGHVIDPATGQLVGKFDASGPMVPDGDLGIAFFVGQTRTKSGTDVYTLESFDIDSFLPIATLDVGKFVGNPTHLIRWGKDGLAFTTNNDKVYLISGGFMLRSEAGRDPVPVENVHRTW
jgi:hypothetical protein